MVASLQNKLSEASKKLVHLENVLDYKVDKIILFVILFLDFKSFLLKAILSRLQLNDYKWS